MIVWRGCGFLVAIFAVIGLVVGQQGAEKIWGTPLPEKYQPGAQLVGMLLAAALTYLLQAAIKYREVPRIFIDKVTQQEIEFKPKHDLFFIPVKFWPIILCGYGIFLYFNK